MRGYSAVGLIGTKKDPNIGGSLRAAHCYGAALVAIQGSRCKEQSSDTTKMARHIPLIHTENLLSMIPEHCSVVAVELVDDAMPLQLFTHPERAFYIFGPENGNVPKEIIEKSNHVVYIPTKYCMNLAATVNVVLYDRMAKREKRIEPFVGESNPAEVFELETYQTINVD